MRQIGTKLQTLTAYQPDDAQYTVMLHANESFLLPPDWLRQQMLEAVAQCQWNRYPDPYATELCQSFGKYYDVPWQHVTAGNGSDEIIGILFNSLLQGGDKVLTLQWDFSMYGFYAHMNGCQTIEVEKQPDLSIDCDKVIAVANDNEVAMIIFSNPCNPTSRGLQRQQVQRIIESTQALVVVDEAYMEFYDQSVLDLVEQYQRLIVLKTCSKALGLAGVRLGFAVANGPVTQYLHMGKSPYNVNSISQAMGKVLLDQPQVLQQAAQQLIASRDSLYQQLQQLQQQCPQMVTILPSDTNFVFIEMTDAATVYDQLKQQGILVRCMKQYLRITAGTQQENKAVVKALQHILAQEESP